MASEGGPEPGRPEASAPIAEERHPLRVAVEARDLDAIVDAFAPDAVLHSPITGRFRFHGREEIRQLYGAVFDAFEDIRYREEFGSGDLRTLVLQTEVADQELEEVQLLRLDERGRIRELTIFVRPLPGVAAMAAALGPRLARRRGRARAALVRLLIRPLVVMIRVGDRVGMRLVKGS